MLASWPSAPIRPSLLIAVSLVVAACGARVESAAAPVLAADSAPGPPPPCFDCRPGEGPRLHVCVLSEGRLLEVPVEYNPATGDTIFEGRPFAEAFPLDGSYAGGQRWYLHGEMMPVMGRRYPLEKYGLPRILRVDELQPFGTYRGVPLFVEAGDSSAVPDIVYVPVRPGCEFQTYLQAYSVGAVRG